MSSEQKSASTEKKKINLQDAIKQKLAAKKQGFSNNNNSANYSTATKGMKSQLTKKTNNQRKRTGV